MKMTQDGLFRPIDRGIDTYSNSGIYLFLHVDLFPHTTAVTVYIQVTVYTVIGTSKKGFNPSQTLFWKKNIRFLIN